MTYVDAMKCTVKASRADPRQSLALELVISVLFAAVAFAVGRPAAAEAVVDLAGAWAAIALGSFVQGGGLAAFFAAGRWKRTRV
jgi:hypothetical protein